MRRRKPLWLLALAGTALLGITLALWGDAGTDTWWYVPGYLGLTTAICGALAALGFPRRGLTWAVLAGGATGLAGLLWAFVLWVAGGDADTGPGYVALLLVSLAVGAGGLTVLRAAAGRRRQLTEAAELLTVVLLLVAAAALEAFGFEEGDGNLVGLTLIPAVVLAFALWQLRAEPR
jgi:hypothetical protein